ncbi:MAG: NAD-dependent epimerase/dehydratase family protein [Planctomycetota bacterium]
MRALVTGAAGFAGRHLVAALRAAGHETWASDQAAVPQEPDAPPHIRTLDVTDSAACHALIQEVEPEWVFHLAGIAHVRAAENAPEQALAVNFGGSRHVLEACLAHAPESRVLLVSSGEVYGPVPPDRLPVTEDEPLRPGTMYALSKAAAEMAAHHAAARGLHMVVLRPFNHIGPGQSDAFVASAFARQLARIEAGLQDPVLHVGNLEAVRDFTDARDTVRGYMSAAESGRDRAVYNVTSGRAVRIRDLLDTLISLCRRKVAIEQDPSRMRPVDVPVFHGSGERLARDTGFRADLDLRRTLADVLDYWRAREVSASERR